MNLADLEAGLARLASNHRWAWRPAARRVLDRLPTSGYAVHPVSAVRRLRTRDLESLLSDSAWVEGLETELESLRRATGTPLAPEVAYFSPEFAITELVRQYSGGLGVLAGDHLKAASDLGVPLVGVGLFYRRGFFRQSIKGGVQTDLPETHDPVEFGCVDTGVVVSVPMAQGEVHVKVWRLEVGATPLVLLDTDLPQNSPEDASISDRLYGAERDHRLRQELVLGIGGMRALAALAWTPRVFHLNEGHAGFGILQLLDDVASSAGGSLAEASSRVRDRIVFTTHTPVPAGIELFDRELIEPHLAVWADRWGVTVDSVLGLGADPAAGNDVFNMTALCLRHAGSANGVSRLHGEVSRRLFGAIAGGDRIGSVTNGVHTRSWVHDDLQDLFDERLGPSWARGDPAAWSRAGEIEGDAIRSVRREGAERLAALVSERTEGVLDRDAMVIGFARRLAPYKRATLLLRHPKRLLDLLHDTDRPVQMIFAGKAHPADERGKALLAELLEFAGRPAAGGRMLFIPGYDMEVARAMCAGSDIWLNTPVRLREASGTSGQKAALNGALNCSISDGWWAEMFDGRNGWEIPSSAADDPGRRDDEEAASALDVLDAIAHTYFDSYAPEFIDRIRHAWMSLGPRVTAARMVAEYRDRMYSPAPSRA